MPDIGVYNDEDESGGEEIEENEGSEIDGKFNKLYILFKKLF